MLTTTTHMICLKGTDDPSGASMRKTLLSLGSQKALKKTADTNLVSPSPGLWLILFGLRIGFSFIIFRFNFKINTQSDLRETTTTIP